MSELALPRLANCIFAGLAISLTLSGKCDAETPSVSRLDATFRHARKLMWAIRDSDQQMPANTTALKTATADLAELTRVLPPHGEYRRFALTAWVLLSKAHSLAGDHNKALATITRASRLYPVDGAVTEQLALVHWAWGNDLRVENKHRSAVEHHLTAINLFSIPRFYAAVSADLIVAARDPKEDHEVLLRAANDYADKAIHADPVTPEWRLTKAQVADAAAGIYRDIGDFERALKQSQRAITSHPTVRPFYRTRMDILRSMNRFGEAVRDGETALRLAPYAPELVRALADTRLEWAESRLKSVDGNVSRQPGAVSRQELGSVMNLLNSAGAGYRSLNDPDELNERFFTVRAYINRRLAESYANLPVTSDDAILQMRRYTAAAHDVDSAFSLDANNYQAETLLDTLPASQIHMTRIRPHLPPSMSGETPVPVHRAILPHADMLVDDEYSTDRYEAYFVEIPPAFSREDLFVRFETAIPDVSVVTVPDPKHAQQAREARLGHETDAECPERWPELDRLFVARTEGCVPFNALQIPTFYATQRNLDKANPVEEIDYITETSADEISNSPRKAVWLLIRDSTARRRLWITFKRPATPLPSPFTVTIRVVDWATIKDRAFRRLEILELALKKEERTTRFIQLTAVALKGASQFLIATTNGVEREMASILGNGIENLEENYPDLVNPDPGISRPAAARAIADLVWRRINTDDWPDGDSIEADKARRPQLLRKQSTAKLSVLEIKELAQIENRIDWHGINQMVRTTFADAAESFDGSKPLQQAKEKVADLRQQIDRGELGRIILDRYMTEELYHTLLAP